MNLFKRVFGKASGESTGPTEIVTNCTHLDMIKDVSPSAQGCEECLKTGDRWLHLRLCLSCGHVGCCDSSPNRHARKHASEADHPIIRSFEKGEDWRFCFVDNEVF